MSKIIPGDLVFFLKTPSKPSESTESFVDAVCSVSKINSQVFHVGLFVGETTIIHATSSRGVVKEDLTNAIAFTNPPIIEIHRINCSNWKRKKAVDFAFSVIDAAYNDIFSPNFIDSKGRKAFYCCQLICAAYGREMFDSHSLTFMNSNGEFIEFWIEYFAERNVPIPEGLPGSHPSVIKSSNTVSLIQIIEVEKGLTDKNNNSLILL